MALAGTLTPKGKSAAVAVNALATEGVAAVWGKAVRCLEPWRGVAAPPDKVHWKHVPFSPTAWLV